MKILSIGARSKRLAGLCCIICLASWSCASSSRSATSAAATAAAPPQTATAAAAPAPLLGKFYPSQGHTHLTPGESDDFVYNSNPPTSGPHRELFSDVFSSPIPLPKYVQVHLLEHGNVLLQYNCSCPDIATALSSIALQYDSKLIPANELQPLPADVQNAEDQGMAVIVAPYPHMKSKIALTAWTRLATLPAVDKARIISFINAYLHNQANASQ